MKSISQTVYIKPLSQNEAFKGRRFKTDKHKKYVQKLTALLRNRKIDEAEKYCLNVEFGLSNKGADLDNPLKIFQDVLQKKYNFNDSQIYHVIIHKTIVKKRLEFIKFELTKLHHHNNDDDKKIYIAGQISKLPIEKTTKKFKRAEDKLSKLGYETINPLLVSPYHVDKDWNDYMSDCLRELFKCNAIYMLNNWKDSQGARIEHDVAINMGIEVIYE